MVLMPGRAAGYEGVTRFVLDVMTSYIGLNAVIPPRCWWAWAWRLPLKRRRCCQKALMRPIGSHNENERAASLEKCPERHQ